MTVGRQPHCHGCARPGGGDEGETICRARKNPVNPILLDRASPLALQVRMGQVRMRQVRMIRRAAFDPPSRQSRGRRIGGSKSADQDFPPAPAPMQYPLGLKQPPGLSVPSSLTPVVNHEACAEGCFLGVLAIASTVRLRNRSYPWNAVNHAFTWPGPRSDAFSAGSA